MKDADASGRERNVFGAGLFFPVPNGWMVHIL